MPYMVHGERINATAGIGKPTDYYDYDYPEDLDLRPGSDLHKKLKDEIHQRAIVASGVMSTRFGSWNEIDRTLTTYIDLDDKEKKVKAKDSRKPVSIVFPYSSAILETLLGYMVAAFFRDPVFRYEGVSPDDVVGAILMEKVIDLHCYKSKVPLALHTMFRDGFAYGLGVVAPTWNRRYGFKTVKKETGFISNITGMFKNSGFEKVVEEALLFEGNKLTNIDPYLILPDPTVPIHEAQSGEYFGWLDRTNYIDLLSEEEHDEDLFNVQYLKSVHNKNTSIFGEEKSDRGRKTQGRSSQYTLSGQSGSQQRDNIVTNSVDVINMYVKLVPKEWKLGVGEYPEKWFFSLAADDIIIRAQPVGLDHDMFPIAVCAPDFDGYSTTPISRLESLFGLQGTLDWMFNMHVANVRKAINDMFIYDPYLVNSKDLKSPGPGKLVRMRRPAWGRGVKDAVMQLNVNDVTKQHIQDSQWIVQWMQKIGGADEATMGALRQGGPERLSASEFQGTQQGAFSRLERIARIVGIQSMQDIGYFFASHTQQLMEEESYIKITGQWQEVLIKEYGLDQMLESKGRVKVSPYDLLVDYDFKVRDGSIPGGNFSNIWIKMFEVLAGNPELAERFDIVRIFKHIARNNGAKNVDQFVRVRMESDENVVSGVQEGNMIPAMEGVE